MSTDQRANQQTENSTITSSLQEISMPTFTHVSKYDVIALVGPQGSGKTTQLKKMLEKSDIEFASVGEVLRSILLNSDTLSEELENAKQDMLAGRIINDDVTFKALKDHFEKQRAHGETKQALVFDGFPRSIKQTEHLFELARAYHGKDPKIGIIRLDLDFDVSKKRCLDRAEFARSTGGQVRPDDTEEAISQRLAIYFERWPGIAEMLHQKSAEIHGFPGDATIEEVHSEILEKLFRTL